MFGWLQNAVVSLKDQKLVKTWKAEAVSFCLEGILSEGVFIFQTASPSLASAVVEEVVLIGSCLGISAQWLLPEDGIFKIEFVLPTGELFGAQFFSQKTTAYKLTHNIFSLENGFILKFAL